MSEESKTESAKPEPDDRVKETPTHWEIQIFNSYRPHEGTDQEIADLEAIEAIPGKAPPSMVKMRRKVYAGDYIKLDDVPVGEIIRTMHMASTLTGVPVAMLKRMDWADYCIVQAKATEAITGKA